MLRDGQGSALALDDKSQSSNNAPLTYAAAGVSIESGNDLVKAIKPMVASTKRPGVAADIGGFGGIIDLKGAGYTAAPRIVAATDGIGTKLMVAHAINKWDTVGIDLVAMNVNDLIVQGAEPIGFLDYYACSKLDVQQTTDFVAGVVKGCLESECGLLGGETAEMPGIYQPGHCDGAGTAIGALAADKRILPAKDAMKEGDVILGLASNGCHSNGFSLIRKIVERENLDYTEPAPWDTSCSIGESLLAPTRIYVKCFKPVLAKDLVKGMAHITGGGLLENIPRMLPDHLGAELDVTTWPIPPVFKWLKEKGRLENAEFATTFNTGLGMVVAVDPADVEETKRLLVGEKVFEIGRLVRKQSQSDAGVQLKGLDAWS